MFGITMIGMIHNNAGATWHRFFSVMRRYQARTRAFAGSRVEATTPLDSRRARKRLPMWSPKISIKISRSTGNTSTSGTGKGFQRLWNLYREIV